MLKTLPKTAHQQIVCEANYLRLKKILNNFSKNQYSFRTINPDESSYDITFKTIHKTKHTLIVEAKQKSLKNDFNNFILRIQISLDAKLAEVISYQGEKAVPFFINISDTQSKDEKLQQNRFFTEWLESIFVSGISSEMKI